MTDQDTSLSADFLVSLQELFFHSENVETSLVQMMEVLSKVGNQPPFSLDKILQRGRDGRTQMEKDATRMVQYVEELEQLVRTSALLTTSLELNHVLNDVIDTVITLTGAERAFLLLVQGEDDLVLRAARNSRGEIINEEDVTFSRGIIKNALEEGQPVISTNAQEDERFQDMKSVLRHDLRSIMVIPMLLQGVPLGVLYLDNRLAVAVFHKKSIPTLTAFASQAAISIENARLFERVQESLERTKRELKQLRVQLDDQKVKSQVVEITGSDYFKEIKSMAEDLRARSHKK
jgi:transcriptional regulator with GAF, ATPase, and Fis domain